MLSIQHIYYLSNIFIIYPTYLLSIQHIYYLSNIFIIYPTYLLSIQHIYYQPSHQPPPHPPKQFSLDQGSLPNLLLQPLPHGATWSFLWHAAHVLLRHHLLPGMFHIHPIAHARAMHHHLGGCVSHRNQLLCGYLRDCILPVYIRVDILLQIEEPLSSHVVCKCV